MPAASPSWAASVQATTNPPLESIATAGVLWSPARYEFIGISPVSGAPSASNMRAKIPLPLPSSASSVHTIVKLPDGPTATAGSP